MQIRAIAMIFVSSGSTLSAFFYFVTLFAFLFSIFVYAKSLIEIMDSLISIDVVESTSETQG